MKHTIEIDRLSDCGAWAERFIVEIRAASSDEALALVEYTLQPSERIVATPGSHHAKPA